MSLNEFDYLDELDPNVARAAGATGIESMGKPEIINRSQESHSVCWEITQESPTDTPRTETYVLNPHPQVVPADFARDLERELLSARHDAFNLANALSKSENENANVRNAYLKSVERDDFLTQENAMLRSQRDRAVDIADKIWADCSNGSEHTELAAIKSEIK